MGFLHWGSNLEPGPDKIAIGVLFSTRGSYASLGREGLHGALTAIAEINADAVTPVLASVR